MEYFTELMEINQMTEMLSAEYRSEFFVMFWNALHWAMDKVVSL